MGRRSHLQAALGGLIAVALVAAGCSGDDAGEGGEDGDAADEAPTTVPAPALGPRDEPLPGVVPTPHALAWVGPDVAVAGTVQVVVAPAVDEPTRSLVTDVLRAAPGGRPAPCPRQRRMPRPRPLTGRPRPP